MRVVAPGPSLSGKMLGDLMGCLSPPTGSPRHGRSGGSSEPVVWSSRSSCSMSAGSPSHWVRSATRYPPFSRIPAFSLPVAAEQRPAGVKFETLTGEDPRDALDRGTDILVTHNPAVVEYVAGQPEFVSFTLPWTRTYVLLEPGNGTDSLAHILRDAQVQRSLADAARVSARPAQPPFWWSELSACTGHPAAESQHRSSRVVYAEGDDVARLLAERVVALTPPGTDVRTAALKPAELGAVLRSGSEKAYVLATPRRSLAPCRDSSSWPRTASILPLIDTRDFLIVRRGSPPLTVEWDGRIRIDGMRTPDAP